MDKFIVNNVSGRDLTIQGQLIQTGSSYTVPDGDIVTWCKDAYLNFLIFQQQVTVSAFNQDISNVALWWVERVGLGNIIY